MIHVITGDGKGKTTSAVGIALRAAGHGWKVLFVQFLKDGSSGEIASIKKIKNITVLHAKENYGFIYLMSDKQLNKTMSACNSLLAEADNEKWDLIILDEVIIALNYGLVDKELLKKTLEHGKELVMTGRSAPEWLVESADYVSEITDIKHPIRLGINAREGIEY